MNKEKFDEFLRLNGLSYKVKKSGVYEDEEAYTVEIYFGDKCIADGNEHYVKKGNEYKPNYNWLYDYIVSLPGSYEWDTYVGKDKKIVRTDDTLEAMALLDDINKLGIPNIYFYKEGCSIELAPDAFEKDEYGIIFKLHDKNVAKVNEWARIIVAEPGNIISGFKKSYEVMEGTFEHTRMYLYW